MRFSKLYLAHSVFSDNLGFTSFPVRVYGFRMGTGMLPMHFHFHSSRCRGYSQILEMNN